MPFSQFPASGLRTIQAGSRRPGSFVRRTTGRSPSRCCAARWRSRFPAGLSAVRGVDDVRAAALARQRILMMLVGRARRVGVVPRRHRHPRPDRERRHRTHARARHSHGARRHRASNGDRCGTTGHHHGHRRPGVGCVLAYGASGLIRNLLWGVKENDPITFIAVVGALLAVAVAASVMPALRVRKLDPVHCCDLSRMGIRDRGSVGAV